MLLLARLFQIIYHPQNGWFEDAPLKGALLWEALFRGHCYSMPPQGTLWQEALSEGPVAGGPHRGLRDGLDPPPG